MPGKTPPIPPEDVVDFDRGVHLPAPGRGNELFLLRGAPPPRADAGPRDALDLSGVAAPDWSAALDAAPEDSGGLLIRIDEAVPAR
ncbi:hypothetical protein [Oleispirillum naphthae]|uniref:hypothetical protein n=1 Tax=Oleispirillum naphthae TaxID=2838853 RepID=UPI0030823D5F